MVSIRLYKIEYLRCKDITSALKRINSDAVNLQGRTVNAVGVKRQHPVLQTRFILLDVPSILHVKTMITRILIRLNTTEVENRYCA